MPSSIKHERPPAVAGSFYEADPRRLRAQVEECLAQNQFPATKESFVGGVVPHAGLMYSGHVAAAFYGAVRIPRRLILLGPNHTGLGADVAINLEGSWRTPLGSVLIDSELAQELARESHLFQEDQLAHAREHSLEVQLPFLQLVAKEFTIVPVCIRRPRFEVCEEVGQAVARVVGKHRDVGVLSSTDLNHYENQTVTLQKDQKAIDAMLSLEPRRLWDTVRDHGISMCGILPTTATLVATKQLGAASASLLKHATSGDINGDYNAVVGYASALIR
jgi:AmmeMemoRadiSam system protein B